MLDWKVGEGEAPDDIQDVEDRPRRKWRIPRWLWLGTLGVLIFAAISAGAYTFLGSRAGEAKIRVEIQQAADLEIWARQNNNRVVFFESLDQSSPREWRNRQFRDWQEGEEWRSGAEVVHAELYDGLAWVDLKLTNKTGKTYREGRFYRRGVDGRWRRSNGDETFWGPSRLLETQYFQIQHRLRDAPYVRQASEGLDEWYRQIRADFGLPAPSGSRVVDVVADPEAAASANLVLKSPHLDLRTSDDSLSNLLRGWLAYKIAEELLQEAAPTLARDNRSTAHRAVVTGIIYWEVNQFAPFTVSETTELRTLLTEAVRGNALIPLRELQPFYSDQERQRLLWPHQVSAASFLAETYGRASISRFLKQTTDPLDRSVQVAFGVPYDQFEAGWRQYIQQKYVS